MIAWIGDNLQTLATLGSASAVYILLRYGARKDAEQLKKDFDERIGKLETKVDQINLRLTHLEGSFEERRYWTSKQYDHAGMGEK